MNVLFSGGDNWYPAKIGSKAVWGQVKIEAPLGSPTTHVLVAFRLNAPLSSLDPSVQDPHQN